MVSVRLNHGGQATEQPHQGTRLRALGSLPASGASADRVSSQGEHFDTHTLHGVVERLRKVHRVDIRGHKWTVLRAQLAARMATRRLRTLGDYLDMVEASPEESGALLDGLLIGSTRFFRDPEVFDAIRALALPRVVDPNHGACLRVWVPGCSTGEEAYSLAMLLFEYFDERNDKRPLRVFATDIRESALAHAKRGVYRPSAMADLSAERRARFFTVTEDGQFRVRDRLRNAVLFAKHDLLRAPPYGRIDLVSCRNLFIYFEESAQRLGLSRLHYALNNQGVLVLGKSESTLRSTSDFVPLSAAHRLYVREHVRLRPRARFSNAGSAP
jgi:two-component system CheB/CheR fusion protein